MKDGEKIKAKGMASYTFGESAVTIVKKLVFPEKQYPN